MTVMLSKLSLSGTRQWAAVTMYLEMSLYLILTRLISSHLSLISEPAQRVLVLVVELLSWMKAAQGNSPFLAYCPPMIVPWERSKLSSLFVPNIFTWKKEDCIRPQRQEVSSLARLVWHTSRERNINLMADTPHRTEYSTDPVCSLDRAWPRHSGAVSGSDNNNLFRVDL